MPAAERVVVRDENGGASGTERIGQEQEIKENDVG
jgi:hypothetical protein